MTIGYANINAITTKIRAVRGALMSISLPQTQSAEAPSPGKPDDLIWRLSVGQYHEMIRTGILTADDPVELLAGWLVYKMPKDPPHRIATRLAQQALETVTPEGWYVVYSRTASACSLVTPGNHSRKSSREAPPSRFSNSAITGTRVLQKTHELLTFSRSRSTTEQEDGFLLSEAICNFTGCPVFDFQCSAPLPSVALSVQSLEPSLDPSPLPQQGHSER